MFDTTHVVGAPPAAVWPWLVQLGKGRAGWYFPRTVERLLPRVGLRTLDPSLTELAVGDRVPDYGGRDEWLEVAAIDPPRALVYRSQRRAAVFSWALLLTPLDGGASTGVHLRFRGAPRSTGLKLRLLAGVGETFDRVTGELMLRGLDERVRSS